MNAAGMTRYPQKPSPAPQAVGAALAQQGQMGQQPMGTALPQPSTPGFYPGDDIAPMRMEGARYMGGREANDTGDENPAAINAAIGEALTRMGGGYRTNANPFKNRAGHMERLQQLGLSETEARLLGETGGF